MDDLRIGYVGAGFLAQKVHLPNLARMAGVRLAALAEVRPALGRAVQARWGIPRLHPDHRALAEDPDIDAVVVSGHYMAQGDIAADLLRAGKPVLMEKPMAISVRQAERILAAEREGGGRLMVAYMKRYDGGNVLARERIDAFRRGGELGAVTYVRNHGFCGNWVAGSDADVLGTDEPVPPPPDPAGAMPEWLPEAFHKPYVDYLQQYTHNVNLVRWLLDAGDDAEVVAVDLDTPMRGLAVLRVAGVRTVIESGAVAYPAWEEHTQVYFEKGWVKTLSPPLLLANQPAAVEVFRGDGDGFGRTELTPETGYTWSYMNELRHFADAVRSGAPFASSGADTLTDVRLVEAIYRRHVQQAGHGGDA